MEFINRDIGSDLTNIADILTTIKEFLNFFVNECWSHIVSKEYTDLQTTFLDALGHVNDGIEEESTSTTPTRFSINRLLNRIIEPIRKGIGYVNDDVIGRIYTYLSGDIIDSENKFFSSIFKKIKDKIINGLNLRNLLEKAFRIANTILKSLKAVFPQLDAVQEFKEHCETLCGKDDINNDNKCNGTSSKVNNKGYSSSQLKAILTSCFRRGDNKSFNNFRKKESIESVELNGLDLSICGREGREIRENVGLDFSGADLCGANLSGIDLSKSDFTGAKLTAANIIHSDLIQAKLIGVDLSYCYLSKSDFSNAIIIGCKGCEDMITDDENLWNYYGQFYSKRHHRTNFSGAITDSEYLRDKDGIIFVSDKEKLTDMLKQSNFSEDIVNKAMKHTSCSS